MEQINFNIKIKSIKTVTYDYIIAGLKIPRTQVHVGSIPTSGTN